MAVIPVFILVALSITVGSEATDRASIYSLTVKDIHGNDFSLDKYRGKVLTRRNYVRHRGASQSHVYAQPVTMNVK